MFLKSFLLLLSHSQPNKFKYPKRKKKNIQLS